MNKTKSILILTACVLSSSAYPYCAPTDGQCAVREAQAQREQDLRYNQVRAEQERAQYERERDYERELNIETKREQDRDYWQRQSDKETARDTLCIYTDCN